MKTLKTILLSLALAVTALAQATVVTKEGTGEAAVVGKDELKAYEEAQKNALRAAVEQAAGVRIDADTTVINNQLVRDQVFANTSGYVKSFDVLSKKVDKGVATVKVKAQVITENLDKDITAARDLVKRMGTPSIVIVVQEQTVPLDSKSLLNTENLATVLTDTLKADGWLVKDAQAMNKSLKLEGAATLGATEIKEIKNLLKAQYVLYGKAVLRHQDGGDLAKSGAYYPVTGEYDLVIAATDSEEQLAKLNGKLSYVQGKQPSPLLSYERTAFELIKANRDSITTPVRKAILEAFRDQQVNGKKLNVTVSGLDSFGAAKDFKKALEAISGIKEAVQDNFSDGKADFRVVYLGSSSDFAAVAEASTFKKKKLNVVSVSGNTLELKVGK